MTNKIEITFVKSKAKLILNSFNLCYIISIINKIKKLSPIFRVIYKR